jgi:NAD(P)-dependent dehydrogenase (short-subunit alcohol dehydrogenase family)
MSPPMTVLITGSNSGFGRLTALTLARKGYTVFASMRGVDGKNAEAARVLRAWAETEKAALHVVELDVTSDTSVDRAVQHVLATTGRIDVVVNNAGVSTWGLVETFTPAQLQSLFDINLFGVQRVNRAALPSMREQRSGLLVHVTSVMARLAVPVLSPYNASKWALEALAETYRYELAPVGVDSVIVQPGAFPTEIGSKLVFPADPERARGYGANADLPQRVMAGMKPIFEVPNPPDSQDVADAIVGLIEMPAGTRPLRTVVDPLWGDAPRTINAVTDQVQAGALQGMGMGDLLSVRKA